MFAVLLGLAGAVWRGAIDIPDRLDPWAPLDVNAEPDWLTGFRLQRARTDPARCLAALSRTGMQYDVLPDRETGPGCGFENAVRLRAAPVRLGTQPSLSCPMALSFFMWQQHALQPAAHARFGQSVVAVAHLGSYACRNINKGEGDVPGASRSRHATADAFDIAGFTLADGRRVTVLKDWPHADAASTQDPAARLLLDAHRGACVFFNGVLGPDYNAVHRNHFHLETGGYDMCR